MTPAPPPSDDGIPDETLMMFADGTLAEAEMQHIADKVAGSPELEQRLAAFLATRDGLRGAFSGVINARPPERLLAAVMTAGETGKVVPFTPRERKPQQAASRWMPMAIAAGFVGAVAGLAGFLAGQNSGRPESAVAALAAAGPDTLATLSSLPDGQRASLDRGLTGTVSGSWRMADRRFCRTLSVEQAATGTAAEGVACLVGDRWQIRLALPKDTSGQVFRPASGAGPVDALLEAGGATEPLSRSEIEALISRGWR